ncbi:hypothetical protein MHB77_30165 [Paenibacillus sp. FSL K6-3166]|uniref:hypothetical protein n=1 Tax=Paenibacillus sp. FSL K6-3166 TaxID=2921492 RepID=UPI0030F72D00
MKEWLYELLEKLTGKHYHIFDKPSQIEYLDGTQFFHCRCGSMAKIKRIQVVTMWCPRCQVWTNEYNRFSQHDCGTDVLSTKDGE